MARGVFLPRLAGRPVAHTAPEVDDLLATMIDAAGAAQLVSRGEILDERIPHRFKAGAYVSTYK
jgi:hypothetical protein